MQVKVNFHSVTLKAFPLSEAGKIIEQISRMRTITKTADDAPLKGGQQPS
jgi:hypothetical protein